jgi:hypothetical protein
MLSGDSFDNWSRQVYSFDSSKLYYIRKDSDDVPIAPSDHEIVGSLNLNTFALITETDSIIVNTSLGDISIPNGLLLDNQFNNNYFFGMSGLTTQGRLIQVYDISNLTFF